MPLVALDLSLHPDDAARLPRLAELARLRAGRARATPLRIVWHDTPEGALAADGLALAERQAGRETVWRLEQVRGTPEQPWFPGTLAPLAEQAAQPADLSCALPGPLLPVAAFDGVLRTLPLADAALSVTLLEGSLRAVAAEQPVCHVMLGGDAEVVTALALALARQMRLAVPAQPLASAAAAVAGRAVTPIAIGAPALATNLPVGPAFAALVAHLAGVILHWASQAHPNSGPEPVHQMRVALRRLRSAFALFRRAVGEPALAEATHDLRALQRVLGPARDWDVFTAGTGQALAAALPDDRPLARLLAAAERRRLDAYAALADFLAGPQFRGLGLRLAALAVARPWETLPPPEDAELAAKQAAALDVPLAEFAGHALSRRLDRIAEAGPDLSALTLEELHRLRIQAKRLRYAMEFFAPLYPPRDTRRLLRRVSALQERLGHLNDGAVAARLMAELGGGGERAYAVGVVRGFVAAGMRRARAKVDGGWRKTRRLEPFWT